MCRDEGEEEKMLRRKLYRNFCFLVTSSMHWDARYYAVMDPAGGVWVKGLRYPCVILGTKLQQSGFIIRGCGGGGSRRSTCIPFISDGFYWGRMDGRFIFVRLSGP